VHPADEFSFPSGHTAAAFVMVSILGSFYPVLLLPLVILASFIGISRVYLGVHYPSDVLAGAILGIVCGGVAKWMF
jgi:undecaprenyl-diphosphatase